MSVLERIESGQLAVCKYHEWDSGDYYTKEPEATGKIIRLARIGVEAEKAIKHCQSVHSTTQYTCMNCVIGKFPICKMVREGRE